MKARIVSPVFVVGFLTVASFAAPGFLRAQAPAGPLPPAQPQPSSAPTAKPQEQQPRVEVRTSIAGAWRLNRDDSDDPQKRREDSRGGGSSGGRGGGGGVHVGIPGVGGHGGYGGRRSESDEDRERMQELFRPPISMTLTKKDTEVDLLDSLDRKRVFITDSRKPQKPDKKDDTYLEIAAHWDGNRLVSEEKTPHGSKMSRTFELSYDGTQLFETLHMTSGRSETPVILRFVYDPAPDTKQ